MLLSKEQNKAIQIVMDWYTQKPHSKNKGQVFKLFGYAGTGKTTLAKEVLALITGEVIFGAYTGKAASVMRAKGCVGAETIHSLIYLVKDKSKALLLEFEQELLDKIAYKDELEDDTAKARADADIKRLHKIIEDERKKLSSPSFSLNPDSQLHDAALLILDEGSMIDTEMGQDLLSFKIPILVLGDPEQLPPIYGAGFFNENPDILLTEVHRQARGNPIIDLATIVRSQKPLEPGKYGKSEVIAAGAKLGEAVLEYDQILVGRNITRTAVNARIRKLLGFTEWYPVHGEKLICLRNNKDLGLLNGTMWTVEDIGDIDNHRINLTLVGEGGHMITVEMHAAPFRGEKIPYYEKKEAQEFDFGYAITVHKSQGSQWENVLVVDESSCFGPNRFKWLYTGITRAANTVAVLKTPKKEWRD
jgi:exodeoxyribonuclease-5